MQAVILAAGLGTRLRPRTEWIPKGLIDVGGRSLLDRSVHNLASCGVEEAIVVTGYHENLICAALGEKLHGVRLRYVLNQRFAETGSMYSFSQVEGLVDTDILLLESDLLYEARAIEVLLSSRADDAILVADLLCSGDDVYICADSSGTITHLGKDLGTGPRDRALGALVGISRLSQGFMNEVFRQARADYAAGRVMAHYEECLMATSRKTGRPVRAVFCAGLHWLEIDNEADLERARDRVFPEILRADVSGFEQPSVVQQLQAESDTACSKLEGGDTDVSGTGTGAGTQ